MANEDHVARLKQDTTAWNRWRGENESVIPDLRYADLSGANLARADLSLADLRQADLRADMSDANLFSANLTLADLDRADLSDANLSGANLSHLDLDGTVLNRAVFRETILADMDLTNVIGLDTCEHFGPSSIDFRTLQKSPNLPLVFLRGVGLPDRLIDPPLAAQPTDHILYVLHQLLGERTKLTMKLFSSGTLACQSWRKRRAPRSQRRPVRTGPSSKIVGGNPWPSLLSSLRPVLCAPKSGLPARSFCVFVHCQCAICDLKFTVSFATNPNTIKQADVDRLSL